MKAISFLDRAIELFETVCLTVLLSAMTCILFAQVTAGFFGKGIPWAGELALYLMVWTMCLGASAAVRSRSHIAVGLVADRLRGLPARIVGISVLSLCFLLCIGAFILGTGYVRMSYVAGLESVSLNLPMWIVYSALPATAALMSVRVVVLAVRGLAIRERSDDKERQE